MQDAVFLNGLLCDARLWAAQTAALSGTVNVVCPDLSRHDRIETMAESVLRDAPQHFALAGFSMGGFVALEIISRAPQRVTRLALLDAGYQPLAPQVAQYLRSAIVGLQAGELESYLDRTYPLYVAPDRVDDAALRKKFKAMGLALGTQAALNEINAQLTARDYTGLLPQIACPTAIIVGALDQRKPLRMQKEMVAAIPGAVLTIIDGAAHFAPIERPAAVTAALVDWLAQ